MSAAFTIGSLGDILGLLQVAWDLRAALDEASGASAEIWMLIADIDAFVVAVQDIQRTIERRRRAMRPDVLNAVGAALAHCRDALRKIQQRIERAQKQISSPAWKRYWGATAWSILGGKKDVEDLRRRLVEQVNLIHTYLALSQAEDQDMIVHHMELHGATIERIYSVVQDIQTRFDVGVPSFRFFDRLSGAYYPPLARTSLQRLNDFWKAFSGGDVATDIENYFKMPWEEVLRRVQSKRSVSFISRQRLFDWPIEEGFASIPVECVFFKEAAFGEWQVLVSAGRGKDTTVIKHLLERKHTIGVACNCTIGHCSALHREYRQRERRMDDTIAVYNQAATLLAKAFVEWNPNCDRQKLSDVIFKIFDRCPDPDLLRSQWIAKIETGTHELEDKLDLFFATANSKTTEKTTLAFSMDDALQCSFQKPENISSVLRSLVIREETPYRMEGGYVILSGCPMLDESAVPPHSPMAERNLESEEQA